MFASVATRPGTNCPNSLWASSTVFVVSAMRLFTTSMPESKSSLGLRPTLRAKSDRTTEAEWPRAKMDPIEWGPFMCDESYRASDEMELRKVMLEEDAQVLMFSSTAQDSDTWSSTTLCESLMRMQSPQHVGALDAPRRKRTNRMMTSSPAMVTVCSMSTGSARIVIPPESGGAVWPAMVVRAGTTNGVSTVIVPPTANTIVRGPSTVASSAARNDPAPLPAVFWTVKTLPPRPPAVSVPKPIAPGKEGRDRHRGRRRARSANMLVYGFQMYLN
mmetsp:Transcript_16714/g.52241  ORF Transcript_16714/g.52241 Transcript_16714/m.52241 type:complete len:274 (+) Transcript_16714:1089-1910(+)